MGGKIDKFLAFTNEIIKSHLKITDLTAIEELGAKIRVYHIFQSNFDFEIIYSQLLELFASDDLLRPLLPEILAYHNRITNKYEIP